jgi:GT2 family glycosyltransferase
MISLVIVNYRSASLAAAAIRSAHAATSQDLQVVVVDNSCDPAEAQSLRDHADELIVSKSNRGYGGAINDARSHCKGSFIVVANPDVIFGEGSIDTLLAAMSDDVAVAGPALFWDDHYSWILPPSELITTREKLEQAVASRLAPFARWRGLARARSRARFWSLTDVTPMNAISGAVMAIRVSDLDAVNGFDERFALYFEENDLLRRLTRRGRSIVYVPQARCRHIYNQSAGNDRQAAAEMYARSEVAYLEKWSGKALTRFLKALERPLAAAETAASYAPMRLPHRDVIIEASPLASFWTAAGHIPATDLVEIPTEVWSAYRAEVLHLRVLDRRTAQVLANYVRYRS